jgi:hypothetical protein
MDYDLLWQIANRVRFGEKLSTADGNFIRNAVPAALSAYPRLAVPKTTRHAAGFTIGGAPVRTFLSTSLVLSAQRVLGRRYGGTSAFYDQVESHLAMCIMRSNFHGGAPKGMHCCAQCTLAVYPVLEAGAIRWFDSRALAKDVRQLIEGKQWMFRNFKNTRMLEWSLGATQSTSAALRNAHQSV